MKKLLILGAGTAGTIMANKLSQHLSNEEWHITIVDNHERIIINLDFCLFHLIYIHEMMSLNRKEIIYLRL